MANFTTLTTEIVNTTENDAQEFLDQIPNIVNPEKTKKNKNDVRISNPIFVSVRYCDIVNSLSIFILQNYIFLDSDI